MLHQAIGCSRAEALDSIPEAIGWQMIHDLLDYEGCPRKWMNADFGDPDTDLTNWRESAKAETDEDLDDY